MATGDGKRAHEARVLVVDDSQANLNALRRLLSPVFADVLLAASGERALELLSHEHVDIVISDQRMPGVTGIELAAKVRQRTPSVVIILVTAYTDLEPVTAAINTGSVDGFFVKPLDADALLRLIHRELRRVWAERERDRLGEELRRSEQRYRSLFETAGNALVVTGQGDEIEDANRAARALFRADVAALRGRRFSEFGWEERDRQALLEARRCVAGGEAAGEARVALRAGDARREAEVRVTPCGEGEPSLFLSVVHDVTERNAMEQSLRRVQRAESIARLAGGVAHEFNNLLGAILGTATHLLRGVEETATGARELSLIAETARRGAELANSLRTLGRHRRPKPELVDLARLVPELAAFIDGTLAERGVRLRVDVPDDVPMVLAHRGEFQQVLLNLVLNAADAVRTGDEVHITVGPAAITRDGRPFVNLAVVDGGAGMSPETVERAFEPFFTTKEEGEGLGLAIVAGIVSSWGGDTTIDSEPGRGTRVALLLPVPSQEPEEVSFVGPIDEARGGRGETILVIDDERAIRETVQLILVEAGYRVLLAATGEEGVTLFREQREKVAAIILDVYLPDMPGEAVFDTLHELAPEIPVIVATGYAPLHAKDEASDFFPGCRSVLEKPYDAQQLEEAVAAALGTRGGHEEG